MLFWTLTLGHSTITSLYLSYPSYSNPNCYQGQKIDCLPRSVLTGPIVIQLVFTEQMNSHLKTDH